MIEILYNSDGAERSGETATFNVPGKNLWVVYINIVYKIIQNFCCKVGLCVSHEKHKQINIVEHIRSKISPTNNRVSQLQFLTNNAKKTQKTTKKRTKIN